MRHLSRNEPPHPLFRSPKTWHPDSWIDERSFRKNHSVALDWEGFAMDSIRNNRKRGRKDEARVRLTRSLLSPPALSVV